MELELSRMAFFCDGHSQWCALPSLAIWTSCLVWLCLCTRAWRRFWGETLKHQAQKLSVSPPLPPSSDFSFCVVSAESQSVSWMFENQAQNSATHSWVGIWKSLSWGCFEVFFLVWIWKTHDQSCRRNWIGQFTASLMENTRVSPLKHVNQIDLSIPMVKQCDFPKSHSAIQKTA